MTLNSLPVVDGIKTKFSGWFSERSLWIGQQHSPSTDIHVYNSEKENEIILYFKKTNKLYLYVILWISSRFFCLWHGSTSHDYLDRLWALASLQHVGRDEESISLKWRYHSPCSPLLLWQPKWRRALIRIKPNACMPKLSVPRRGSSYYPPSKKYSSAHSICKISYHWVCMWRKCSQKEYNVRVRRYKLFHLMQRFLLRIKLKDWAKMFTSVWPV